MNQNYLSSCYKFDELRPSMLYSALKLRSDVFVVEQNCIYPDLDNKDTLSGTRHVFLHSHDDNSLLGYTRCLAPGVSYDGASIGRVVVAPSARGKGIARALMQYSINQCLALWPATNIEIGAQCYLTSFYESLGFKPTSQPYDEDGIMHLDMILPVDV